MLSIDLLESILVRNFELALRIRTRDEDWPGDHFEVRL